MPKPGEGDVQLGYSRKTASSSWDASGNAFDNTTTFEGHTVPHYHDFGYVYLSGEVGLHERLSTRPCARRSCTTATARTAATSPTPKANRVGVNDATMWRAGVALIVAVRNRVDVESATTSG